MYNIGGFSMAKYSYFQIICENHLFITWLKGGLKVWLKGDLKVAYR